MYANALFASAILCVSSFFFTAYPWLPYAAMISSANFLYIGFPVLESVPARIRLKAKNSFLSCFTSTGT